MYLRIALLIGLAPVPPVGFVEDFFASANQTSLTPPSERALPGAQKKAGPLLALL